MSRLRAALPGLAVFVLTILLLLFLWSSPGALHIQGAEGAPTPEPNVINTVMSALVSVVLLGASLWVILSRRYDDAAENWAIAVVGSIIGFWLRGPIPS